MVKTKQKKASKKDSETLAAFFKKSYEKLIKFVVKFAGIMVGYMILSFIFLGIYDSMGFERTLLILLIGVFYYGIRK